MAQHAARVDRAERRAQSTADALLPAMKLFQRFGLHLLAVILGILLMLPFYWALASALKQAHEVRLVPPLLWPPNPQWHNFLDVWNVRLFGNWYWNTIVLTAIATTGAVISSSLGGYAFARFRFPGKNLLFSVTMSTILLPQIALLVPNFFLFWQLGWLNTYLPLTVPFWFGSAFFIFLFRQFFLTIPLDLDEAARIDGASYPRIFWSIVLPLSGPVYATTIPPTYPRASACRRSSWSSSCPSVGFERNSPSTSALGIPPRRLKKCPYGLPASRSSFAPRSAVA
jgi:multiple sugar transport system permease protein